MTKEQAVRLGESEWWKQATPTDIVLFQLYEPRLCMPFAEFHEAVEQVLGRPVFTHEFASADQPGGLREEAAGIAPQRSLGDILALIPPHKLILVSTDEER